MIAFGHAVPKVRILAARLPACAAAFLLLTTSYAIGDDEQLDPRLTQLDERSKTIKDLTADFVEKKHTVLLREPLVSKGRVKVMESRTRWDTTEPHATTLFTDDEQVAIYFPSRKTAEVYPIDRRLRSLIVSPLPRLATLEQHFRIKLDEDAPSTESLLLILLPKTDALAEFILEARLTIDLALGVVRRFEMIDPDGDRTVIEFAEIRTNVGLTRQDVVWSFPPGTQIVRPLDPGNHEPLPAPGSNSP